MFSKVEVLLFGLAMNENVRVTGPDAAGRALKAAAAAAAAVLSAAAGCETLAFLCESARLALGTASTAAAATDSPTAVKPRTPMIRCMKIPSVVARR